jgi:hypothetical protein
VAGLKSTIIHDSAKFIDESDHHRRQCVGAVICPCAGLFDSSGTAAAFEKYGLS